RLVIDDEGRETEVQVLNAFAAEPLDRLGVAQLHRARWNVGDAAGQVVQIAGPFAAPDRDVADEGDRLLLPVEDEEDAAIAVVRRYPNRSTCSCRPWMPARRGPSPAAKLRNRSSSSPACSGLAWTPPNIHRCLPCLR